VVEVGSLGYNDSMLDEEDVRLSVRTYNVIIMYVVVFRMFRFILSGLLNGIQ